MADIIQCDRCKGIVGRRNSGHLSLRSPESMKDSLYGATVELDLCEDCFHDLNPLGEPRETPMLAEAVDVTEIERSESYVDSPENCERCGIYVPKGDRLIAPSGYVYHPPCYLEMVEQ